MATERQPPDAVLDSSNYTTLDLADIDEDPDSPDANWGTWGGNGDTVCRTSFATPGGPPSVGADLQEFRVLIRKTAADGNDTTWSLELFENGSQVSVLATGTTTSLTGEVVSGTWNASALATADGSLVECALVQTGGGSGNPGDRRGVEVGALEWNVVYDPIKEIHDFESGGVPSGFTALTGGNGSVTVTGGALVMNTGGTAAGDYAGVRLDQPLNKNALTILFGEIEVTGNNIGANPPYIIALHDSSGAPVAATAATINASKRLVLEDQTSSSVNGRRWQTRFLAGDDAYDWYYHGGTRAWESAGFDESNEDTNHGHRYGYAMYIDGSRVGQPMRARIQYYGKTDDAASQNQGLQIVQDSGWRDFGNSDGEIKTVSNQLWVVLGDITNDVGGYNTQWRFHRLQIGQFDADNVDEFALWNRNHNTSSAPRDYQLYEVINPFPEQSTLWFQRQPNGDSPYIARGSNTWVKDGKLFKHTDGFVYITWQRRDSGTGKSIMMGGRVPANDILNGTVTDVTELFGPGSDNKVEFGWLTRDEAAGAWVILYGVETSGGSWRIEGRQTSSSTPLVTVGSWSSPTTLLSAGAAGKYDDGGVSHPVPVLINGDPLTGQTVILFSGHDGSNNWQVGAARSNSGFLSAHTREDEDNPLMALETFTTLIDGAQTNVTNLLVDSHSTGGVAGDVIYAGEGAPFEATAFPDSTHVTVNPEVSLADNLLLRSYYGSRLNAAALRLLPDGVTWHCQVTAFGIGSGNAYESVGDYRGTGNADPTKCTWRPFRTTDTEMLVYAHRPRWVVPSSFRSCENLGRVDNGPLQAIIPSTPAPIFFGANF